MKRSNFAGKTISLHQRCCHSYERRYLLQRIGMLFANFFAVGKSNILGPLRSA